MKEVYMLQSLRKQQIQFQSKNLAYKLDNLDQLTKFHERRNQPNSHKNERTKQAYANKVS